MSSDQKFNEPANSLATELERVLGQQMEIIQEQQAQATRVIRVSLTTAGLILTLVSIAASSGIVRIPSLGELSIRFAIISDISFIMIVWLLIGTFLLMVITFVFLRIFAPALAVLSPDAGDTSAFRSLVNLAPFQTRDRSVREVIGGEYSEIFENEVTLRTGIDADKAEELLGSQNAEEEILEYHIGCVRGNEAIIKTNRRHLSEIYRSAATASFLLIGILM